MLQNNRFRFSNRTPRICFKDLSILGARQQNDNPLLPINETNRLKLILLLF